MIPMTYKFNHPLFRYEPRYLRIPRKLERWVMNNGVLFPYRQKDYRFIK